MASAPIVEPSEEAPPKEEPPKTDTPAPTGQTSPYDPNALPVLSSEPSASALWPAWRRDMMRWEWKQIPGSDLSTVVPSPPVPGAVSARIDAWNGLAADTRTSRLFSAGNGGHADYSGNEVYEIDLSVDAPRWRMLRAPTPKEFIVASNQTKNIYNDYYLDGRPSSTHTYYALNFISTRNAIFKFGAGSLWGSGNEANWKTDAFSLQSSDWQPAGTWPDAMPNSRKSVLAASTCMNPANEQVYVGSPQLRRFDPSSGTFTTLASWLDNSTAVYASACAVDPVRNRVVYFRDLYRKPVGGLLYDIARDRFSRITFQGDAAAEIMKHGYNFAWYEPKVGQFLFKTRDATAIYSVDPVSWDVRRVATIGGESMPDAMNGVHTRWQRMPNLGGYAFYPKHGNGVWFLAIE